MDPSFAKLPLFFSYIGVAVLAGTVVAYYEITYQTMVMALFVLVGGWFILLYRRFSKWRNKRQQDKFYKHLSKEKGVRSNA